jgi:uncharacterized integral membrane protein
MSKTLSIIFITTLIWTLFVVLANANDLTTLFRVGMSGELTNIPYAFGYILGMFMLCFIPALVGIPTYLLYQRHSKSKIREQEMLR